MASRPYWGTCLVGGRHTPGTEAWRECPLRNAAARSERSKKAVASRWAKPGASKRRAGGIDAQR